MTKQEHMPTPCQLIRGSQGTVHLTIATDPNAADAWDDKHYVGSVVERYGEYVRNAVNAHAGLVAALRYYFQQLDDQDGDMSGARVRMRDALAKAEGNTD